MQLFNHGLMSLRACSQPALRGNGYLAGEPPATSDPDEPDGRFKILNVPSRGRVSVFERHSMSCIASVLSEPDGTWRVGHVDPARHYFVVGFDDRMLQNAAIQDWISPAELPSGPPAFVLRAELGQIEVGVAFSGRVIPLNASGVVTYAVTDGTLPPGVTLDAGTGYVTGTATGGGDYNVEVTGTDGASNEAAVRFRLYMPTEAVGIAWSQSTVYGSLTATAANMRDANPEAGPNTGGATGGGATEWIMADLGAPTVINRVTVGGGNLSGWGGVSSYLNGRAIQVSLDASTWTTVSTVSGVADSGTLDRAFDFAARTARYVRLLSSGYLATATFRVYG